VLNILPADNLGSGSIWVAQRVPDNHFHVTSNQFSIRDVDFDSD